MMVTRGCMQTKITDGGPSRCSLPPPVCVTLTPPPPVPQEQSVQWENFWVMTGRLNCRHRCCQNCWDGAARLRTLQPGGQGSFWAGRRLGEPQTLWPDEEGRHQGSPGGIAGHLSGSRDGEAGGFPGGEEGRVL